MVLSLLAIVLHQRPIQRQHAALPLFLVPVSGQSLCPLCLMDSLISDVMSQSTNLSTMPKPPAPAPALPAIPMSALSIQTSWPCCDTDGTSSWFCCGRHRDDRPRFLFYSLYPISGLLYLFKSFFLHHHSFLSSLLYLSVPPLRQLQQRSRHPVIPRLLI